MSVSNPIIIFLFLLLSPNFLLSQIDQSYFYERYEELDPRSIEKTSDNGFIISGIEASGIGYIMKVDSSYDIEKYLLVESTWGNYDPYSENLSPFTDSTYLFMYSVWDNELGIGRLLLYEINDTLGIEHQVSYDLGFEPIPLNAVKISHNENLIGIAGEKSLIISIDSLLDINYIKEYSIPGLSFRMKKLNYLNDSLIFCSGFSELSYIFSTVNHSGEIINSIETEVNKVYNYDSDIILDQDTICLIYNESDSHNCHFVKMSIELDIYNEFLYNYQPTFFVTPSNSGFVRLDSSGYIFYAGNSIIQSTKNHFIEADLGDYISYKDFYFDSTNVSILVKNGAIPVKQVSQGSEFVVLVGNSLDSIMAKPYLNECLFKPYYPEAPFSIDNLYEVNELLVDTFINYSKSDTINLIEKEISLFNGCPEAPWSVENSESVSIIVYPNPAQDILTIESEGIIQRMSLYSVEGQLVFDKEFNLENISVNLNGLSGGIYFLQIRINDSFYIKKVIIGS